MPAEDFKKLIIWQRAQTLAINIYGVSGKFPREELFGLTDQLRRAAVSIAANIAESSGRWGVKDKMQLLMVARGSLLETRSHLSIAAALKYITDSDYNRLDVSYEELAKSLNAFIRSIRLTNQPTSQPTN